MSSQMCGACLKVELGMVDVFFFCYDFICLDKVATVLPVFQLEEIEDF